MTTTRALCSLSLVLCLAAIPVRAQAIPAEYPAVMTTLGKKAGSKDGVCKVNVPRSDLPVKVGSRPAPAPCGFGGWVAVAAGQGMHVMMGDLVLTEDEVN